MQREPLDSSDELAIKVALAVAHGMGRLPLPDVATGSTQAADQAFVQRLADALSAVKRLSDPR